MIEDINLRIGKIGNAYGALYVEETEGKFFWCITGYRGDEWEEIPKDLYDSLVRFEANGSEVMSTGSGSTTFGCEVSAKDYDQIAKVLGADGGLAVKFMRTWQHDLPLPAYESAGAAGMDLRLGEDVRIEPLSTAKARTGWAVEIPEGFEGQIRLRSSAASQGLIVPNSPGTIDADYRGEVCILLRNLTLDPIEIAGGMRVAQLIIAPVARAQVVEVAELSETERGAGGFGSTGKD